MDSNAHLSILDYALLPFYLGIIYTNAYRNRNSKYPKNHPWRKYYIPALSVKIFGAIFIGLIYGYYYGGGDTYYYFNHAQVINSAYSESSSKWINLLLHIPSINDPNYYVYTSRMEWYSDPASYTIAAITAFFSALTFNTYLPAATLFAFLSFSGVWALFRTFASLYPKLTREVAVSVLFIPSVFVWGSGIFKDTICMFGLGWLTYSTFRFLIQKDFSFRNVFIASTSAFLIGVIKVYILIAYLPALLMWMFFNYSQKITNKSQKLLVKFIFLTAIVFSFIFLMQRFSKELGRYSLEKVAQTSSITRGWISYMSQVDQGSAYDLGDFEPTIGGMLSKFPLAVNVTLFRPYVWEARKVIVILSALEAILFLFITLKVLFVVGPVKIWRTISNDPTIQFSFIFSIIFAFAVGISSYNFGALSRYKIPCLPFYILGVVLIFYKNKPNKKLLAPVL